MELIKSVVCISVLVAKICSAGLIVETSELNESSLIEASIDILESCYADRFSTVGLAGSSAGRIMTGISSRESGFSVTLIDKDSRVVNYRPVDRGSRYKLQVFVITITGRKALERTLIRMYKSEWWNHMASFLLIDLAITKNGCSHARKILMRAWEMNLLNSKFLCFHQTRGQLIYTFNPYTTKAPAPWRQEATYMAKNGHPWTLFSREYRMDESPCDKLDFDKSVDLGGYVIHVTANDMEYWSSPDPEQDPYFINQVQNVTATILMKSLNAKWKLQKKASKKSPGINLKTGETSGAAVEVTYGGDSDICLNILIQHAFANFEITYPFYESQIAILTQYPGHKSQLDKIISVLDRSSRFGVLVVLMITLLFFKFWLGRPITLAIMDLVLIVCNAALHKIPGRIAPRIYLCALFIFVVTIQGIYSGKLASLLTKEERLPTVDTIEDLARSNHTIYGQETHRIIFNQSVFEGRYVAVYVANHCVKKVWSDSKAACVDVVSTLADFAAVTRLHLSRESIGHMYGVYLIRQDWPLEERVNVIFGRAAAGGIMEPLYSRARAKIMNTVKSYEDAEQDSGPKVLTLKLLRFAFVILGIGLGCATITFIIEVVFFGKATANPKSGIDCWAALKFISIRTAK